MSAYMILAIGEPNAKSALHEVKTKRVRQLETDFPVAKLVIASHHLVSQ